MSCVGAGGSYAGCHAARRNHEASVHGSDRRLTDRNAYIKFLEAQAERYDVVASQVEALSTNFREMAERVQDLEDRSHAIEVSAREVVVKSDVRERSLEERVHDATMAAEAAARNATFTQDEKQIIDGQLQRLDKVIKELRVSAEAETSRVRNEAMLGIQEVGQRVNDQLHDFRSVLISEAGASSNSVVREAQATCTRLADDAMGAAEASQRKLEEYQRRTDGGLDVLRVDLTALKAEIAGSCLHREKKAAACFGAEIAQHYRRWRRSSCRGFHGLCRGTREPLSEARGPAGAPTLARITACGARAGLVASAIGCS